jgi:hypothetical protein
MNTPKEFLTKTESAVRKFFGGVDEYMMIIRRGGPPVFSGTFSTEQKRDNAFEAWLAENDQAIRVSLAAQREFLNESFALGTLCGSILQVAATGIRWFSNNSVIPNDFISAIGKKKKSVSPFCIGRHVRGVPIGLIIYAGRNQYNHMEGEELHEPNRTVFDSLARNHGYSSDTPFLDPAFDLNNKSVINYSSNITALLGWRCYDNYFTDMSQLLGI